jgi:intracellular sulfur oxidation DsrE/DsrF family protein
VPVGLNVEHAMFNIDAQHTTNGTSGGYPVALRHMWMLGTANIARATGIAKKLNGGNPPSKDQIQAILDHYHVVGIMHGSAITWALSDAWWAANVAGATANPVKEWLDKIADLRAKGLDITLEACGVTMYGKGLTNADLYTDTAGNREILVNQGAIGRIIDLEQNGWAYIQEGSVKSLVNGANN